MNDKVLYFLDTNAASEFMRGRDLRLVERVNEHMPQVRLSAIVWKELEYRAKKYPEQRRYRDNLVKLRERIAQVEPFDEAAASLAVTVQVSLETRKPNAQPIGYMDCLIAGHALSRGAVVVTHNVGEFARVPMLHVEDWQTGE